MSHIAFVGSPEEFVFAFFDYHSRNQKSTRHSLSNHTCEIDGDVAHTETYGTFFGHNHDGTVDLVGVRYNDRLEKRNGEWKIADRVTVIDCYGQLKGETEITDELRKTVGYEGEAHAQSRQARHLLCAPSSGDQRKPDTRYHCRVAKAVSRPLQVRLSGAASSRRRTRAHINGNREIDRDRTWKSRLST